MVKFHAENYRSRLETILSKGSATIQNSGLFTTNPESDQEKKEKFLHEIAGIMVSDNSVTILPSKKGNTKHSRIWAQEIRGSETIE